MQIYVILGILFLVRVRSASECPDLDTALAKWSSSTTWDSDSV